MRPQAIGDTSIMAVMAIIAVIVALAAVASTARTFSATVDEPAHLAAGMQWLSTGHGGYDPQHTPLARLVIALGPYLHGVRSHGSALVFDEGALLLGSGQHFVDTLASARHGVLVFLVLAAAVVWMWARDLFGELGAFIAVLLLVTNPNILAHAGLATTDMACAATTTLALFLGMRWLDRPSAARVAWCGVAAGVAIASRMSALAFVGAPFAAAYVVRGWAAREWSLGGRGVRGWISRAALCVAAAAAVLLVVYRFELSLFIEGVRIFFTHGDTGHPTFLLGTPSNVGWWYYFPITLLVKTPLPLLLLTAIGAWAAARDLHTHRDWYRAMPLAASAVILAVSLAVRVDLGVRLVLPIYPLLAIAGAGGAITLLENLHQSAGRPIVGGVLAASVVIAVRAQPDHLAYFNALAGDHPERVLVDSNLDWGQDLYRLRDTLRARGIRDSVRIAYFGTISPEAVGVPKARLLFLHERATGWIAASETYLAGEWTGGAYTWLLAYPPVTRIGPSMRLWYIPPPGRQAAGSNAGRPADSRAFTRASRPR
jgi:hypothetical protein